MMKVKVIQETDRGIWPNSNRKWNWISASPLTAVCRCVSVFPCASAYVRVVRIKATKELGGSQLPHGKALMNTEEIETLLLLPLLLLHSFLFMYVYAVSACARQCVSCVDADISHTRHG